MYSPYSPEVVTFDGNPRRRAHEMGIQGDIQLPGAIMAPSTSMGVQWAARYITGLLLKIMPKGVVFSFSAMGEPAKAHQWA